jgi:hypothetical protein
MPLELGGHGSERRRGRRAAVRQLIHVVLAPDPKDGEPAKFYPRALVLVEVDGQLSVHHVYEDDRHVVDSRREANGIILPVVQRWLRNQGWRRYEVFFPDGTNENAT